MDSVRSLSKNPSAQRALEIVTKLQTRLLDRLIDLYKDTNATPIEWLRQQGICGGGVRFELSGHGLNTASINVSQVHYDKSFNKPLEVATALSAIVHPHNPYAPSVHIHISKTTMHTGQSYWRLMADLNPSISTPSMVTEFNAALLKCSGSQYDFGKAQGEKYFYIPALKRHRGVAHFYLEQFATESPAGDEAFAETFGQTMIDAYARITATTEASDAIISDNERSLQRAYHTIYLFQVLTLDRGTTAGILAHADNDVGILGSLPARIDVELLQSWLTAMPATQASLVNKIVACCARTDGIVDRDCKLRLANLVRTFYKEHPQELQNQASGFIVPQSMLLHSNQSAPS